MRTILLALILSACHTRPVEIEHKDPVCTDRRVCVRTLLVCQDVCASDYKTARWCTDFCSKEYRLCHATLERTSP